MTGATPAPPIVIAVAPNGARRTKADHPALPMTANELAEAAARCREAGASVVHLHVRDAKGRHILDAEAYRQAIHAVRRAVDDAMVVQVTSEAAGLYTREQQMDVIRAVRPEATSLALCEIVPDGAAEPEAGRFFEELWRDHVLMQFILYTPAETARFRDLTSRGVIPGGTVLFVLGRYSQGRPSAPADLLPFLNGWAGRDTWMACAFGGLENACAMTAAALGGHARIGFENNLDLIDGRRAPDNAALVEQLAGGMALVGRAAADAATARTILAGGGQ